MHTKVTMEHATILKSFNSLESAFQRFQADFSSVLDTLCCAGGMGGMAPAPIQMAGGGGSRGRLEIYSDIHSSKFY
jgi:hypothetical protein